MTGGDGLIFGRSGKVLLELLKDGLSRNDHRGRGRPLFAAGHVVDPPSLQFDPERAADDSGCP
jgi:hypothetical protein